MSGRWLRSGFLYLLVVVLIVAIVISVFPSGSSNDDIPLNQVLTDAKAGLVQEIEIDGDNLKVTYEDQQVFDSRKEEGASLTELLQQASEESPTVRTNIEAIDVVVKEGSRFGSWIGVLINFLPLIIFGAILLFFMRQAQGSNSQAMSFGKSRARMFTSNRPTVTFNDVAGAEEAKEELKEVVEFLKFPERFAALGARIPRGVLLLGPPGTGKTLLARAVAGEAGVPFFSISGSEFVEMFVGVGASRVRDLFDQAKRNSPCIVFVDEIDAVGRHRGAGLGGSHDEREQTLNQILVEMDGFDTNTNVIIMAATNRPDILDPALLRPGRFDRQVVLDRPDIKGRRAILEVHIKGKPLEKDVDLDVLAKQTHGFSGADIANLVNEGAILAARGNKKRIGMPELEEAIDRGIAGPERKSRVISPKEREIVAHHEAGHALVAHMLPNADPVHKITIVPRGMAGGYTRFLPEEDRYLGTRSQFTAMLAASLGGMAAEEIIFDEKTTGPSDDLERATKIARQMVTRWGMSERLGPRTFGRREEMVFLGREISEQRDYSEKVAEEIDDEVRRIVDQAYTTALSILTDNRPKLEQIAKYLMDRESVEGKDLEALFNAAPGEELVPSEPEGSVMPPEDSEPQDEEKPAARPTGQKPGLAWGGQQSNISLDK